MNPRDSQTADRISQLFEIARTRLSGLSPWEQIFLASAERQFDAHHRLSPKQLDILNAIVEQRAYAESLPENPESD
jgi:hypothetical protein